MVKKRIKEFIAILYPDKCCLCKKNLKEGEAYCCKKCYEATPIITRACQKCGKRLKDLQIYCSDCSRQDHSFTSGKALWEYEDGVKEALLNLKYKRQIWLAKNFAAILWENFDISVRDWEIDYIAEVPGHRWGLASRTYNQAYILAEEVSKRSAIRHQKKLLTFTKRTRRQKDLTREERLVNLKNSIRVNDKINIRDKKILIIDDIYTTGATIDACASPLIEKGASRVFFLVVAIGRGK